MNCPIVKTVKGKVSGSVTHLKCEDSKPVYVYRSIPYAKPPVGNLRFMPPQPIDPWAGVIEGTVIGKQPMQSVQFMEMFLNFISVKHPTRELISEDEDCLHLTVYTPESSSGRKLPVMVWFYGGGFQMGSELFYDGSALAGMNDVIVVTPNYRVGSFGFLSLGKSSQCTGNAGLLDQCMSLEWVRDNIEAFGGNNQNVTIFGESAGAISVHMHVLSPMSKGLFHKAISQSGQATIHGMFYSEEQQWKNTEALLEHLNIKERDEPGILNALQNVEALKLVEAGDALGMKKISFLPCVDGTFLLKHPEQYLADKDFNKVPYIIGCNNTEGAGLMTMVAGSGFVDGLTYEQFMKTIHIPVNDQYLEAWKNFYVKDENDKQRFSKLFSDVVGDGMFVEPAVTSASAHTDAGVDVYMYLGAFQLKFYHDEAFGKHCAKRVDWCICDHGDDVSMIFGFPFTPGEMTFGAKFSEDEIKLSRKCMTYFTNFAKNGDPNEGENVEIKWPKYKCGGEYLIFDHQLSIGKNYASEAVRFWSKTMPGIRKEFPMKN